jgi:hypothetical protein
MLVAYIRKYRFGFWLVLGYLDSGILGLLKERKAFSFVLLASQLKLHNLYR